ncbi:MAG: NYN domain-containing protein, partial [Roseiflexaceae bacterium]
RRVSTAKKGRHVLVVFDRGVYNQHQPLNGYGVTCHFATSPQDADAVIIRKMRQFPKTHDWSLVSNDRRIIDVALQLGVRHTSNQMFIQHMLRITNTKAEYHDEKPEVPLSPNEIEAWRIAMNLPVELSDEQLLMQEVVRDLKPRSPKK